LTRQAQKPEALDWPGHHLDLACRTAVMGILNVTPDSFFDGGAYFSLRDAVNHGLTLAREGADIIDVGGESTRPYSDALPLDEELRRVIPVIKALAQETELTISIDTYKSEVARLAIEAGATMVNDVSALRFDPGMGPLVAEADLPIVLMHMKGTPRDMQVNPTYENLIGEIVAFLRKAAEEAHSVGIRKELIIIDPGIGFGKSFDDNLRILRELDAFSSLGQPIMVGTSNKAFIGHTLGLPPDSRDAGTMATVAVAVMNGADIVRVHNVKTAKETVHMIDAIKSGRSAREA
jgi:dihydropteroate synthase